MKSNVNRGARLRLPHLTAAIFAALTLAACGGGGSGNTVVDTRGVALYTSAASQITVASGTSASFTVAGGGGGSKFVSYQASSSDTKVVTVTLEGTKLTLTGVSGGIATINVTDSAGANVAINVTVPVSSIPGLSVAAPSAVTLIPGNSTQYKIAGGVGPYTAVLSQMHLQLRLVQWRGKHAVGSRLRVAFAGTTCLTLVPKAQFLASLVLH